MKSLSEYLSRIGKSRGFGIQSPWAYSFVKDVISEKLPYYAYSDIENQYLDTREQKKHKLYFRVRNFLHGAPLRIVSMKQYATEDILSICSSLSMNGVLVVEDIFSSDRNYDRWLQLRDSCLIGITFDLYDFAICFMPNGMYKQHYKLNF